MSDSEGPLLGSLTGRFLPRIKHFTLLLEGAEATVRSGQIAPNGTTRGGRIGSWRGGGTPPLQQSVTPPLQRAEETPKEPASPTDGGGGTPPRPLRLEPESLAGGTAAPGLCCEAVRSGEAAYCRPDGE